MASHNPHSDAEIIIGVTDYLRWINSFAPDAFSPVNQPLVGIKGDLNVANAFAMTMDNGGLLLVADATHASWLRGLPIECVLIGFGDSIEIVTRTIELSIFKQSFSSVVLSLPLANPEIPRWVNDQNLHTIGFGLSKRTATGYTITRVGRIVPLYRPNTLPTSGYSTTISASLLQPLQVRA